MEDGKLTWKNTQGFDRIKTAHAQKIFGIPIQTTELPAVNLAKIKNWVLFANFSKLGPAVTPKIILVGVESIDMYARTVKAFIQQKNVKTMTKSEKMSKALQYCLRAILQCQKVVR